MLVQILFLCRAAVAGDVQNDSFDSTPRALTQLNSLLMFMAVISGVVGMAACIVGLKHLLFRFDRISKDVAVGVGSIALLLEIVTFGCKRLVCCDSN